MLCTKKDIVLKCSRDWLVVCWLADIECPLLRMVYDVEVGTAKWNTSERRNKKEQQTCLSGRWGYHQLPEKECYCDSVQGWSNIWWLEFVKFKQSKAVLMKVKTELSVKQNNFVITARCTVEFGGPESRVIIYWMIKKEY